MICPILINPIRDRAIEPRHSLQDQWHAPFFYEDSRHVFFVTTTEKLVSIGKHDRYGIEHNLGFMQLVEIPPLILKTDLRKEVRPKFWGNGGPIGPDQGVIDSATIQRFVTEDAYIRQGIGTTGSVMFGDKKIGPSGAIADVQAKIN